MLPTTTLLLLLLLWPVPPPLGLVSSSSSSPRGLDPRGALTPEEEEAPPDLDLLPLVEEEVGQGAGALLVGPDQESCGVVGHRLPCCDPCAACYCRLFNSNCFCRRFGARAGAEGAGGGASFPCGRN